MSSVDWGLLLVLSILLGSSFFFVAISLRDLPPMSLVFLRVAGGAALLWLFIACKRISVPGGRQLWSSFLVMGLLNNLIPYLLLVWGQTAIASGLAAIFNATAPLFTVIIAGLLLADERFTLAKFVGLAAGFTGTVIIIAPYQLPDADTPVWAQLACLGAAISFASAGVYGKRFAKMGISPPVAAAGQLSTAALVLLPMALLADQPWRLGMPNYQTWAAVSALAGFSTGLAHIIYFRVLASSGASNLLLVSFLIPISALLLGVVFLEEQLSSRHLLGICLVGLGLVTIDGRALWQIRAR